MKYILAALFALAASFGVFASPGKDGCVGNCAPNGQNPSSVDVRNTNTAVGVGVAGAYSGSYLNNTTIVQPANVTVQPATQPAGAPVINNNFPAAAPQPSTVTVKAAPPVYGGNVYPTAPCMGSTQIGGSWLGAGASAGSSWTDAECTKRETSRSFDLMGLKADAIAVLCSSEYAAIAPTCKALKENPSQQPAVLMVDPFKEPLIVERVPSAQLCTTEISASGIKTTICR